MFGFGKGKIELVINKYNFALGETVEGTVTLNLKKPIKAKGVTIELSAKRKVTKGYGTNKSTSYDTLYDFKQPLDGEKEYPPGQSQPYQFRITIPANLNTGPQFGDSALGNVLKTVQTLSGSTSNVTWNLTASLDIPWGVDLNKKVQINVA